MDSPFMGGRMMDSPYMGRVQDSPYFRAQEAKYGHASGFSLGPGMHEAGATEAGSGGGGPAEPPQSTADLTAFVQNLLQQMQLRFQSMSDAIIQKIDEMGTRIEELERVVDEVLKEATADEDAPLPSPSHSPMRKSLAGPASPDIRKIMGPSGSFSGVSVKDAIAKYATSGAPGISRQVSASPSLGGQTPKSPDPRRHSSQGLFNPTSPDPRRHTATGIYGSGVPNSPDPRRVSTPSNYVPTSPDIRRAAGVALNNVPNSPDPRRRTDSFAGMR